jgi:GTP-binding protein HflX
VKVLHIKVLHQHLIAPITKHVLVCLHHQVAAFKATLQETREAKLLLHVVDCSDENYRANIDAVDRVLKEIDAGEVAQLIVMNKIDAFDDLTPCINFDDEGKPIRVWLSAQSGAGVELLCAALSQLLVGQMRVLELAQSLLIHDLQHQY